MRRTLLLLLALLVTPALAQQNPPPTLKRLKVPRPANLADFVRDESAAIALGKALFWDMQSGGDGIVACATCHFHAGADSRTKNQLNPGTIHGATQFEVGGPNTALGPSHFPLHRLSNPADRHSTVLFDSDDVVSSQGIFRADFVDVVPGQAEDSCTPVPDPIWNVGGVNVRRVAPRHTPSVINAAFFFRGFTDGRANAIFNGVNPFGRQDPSARVLEVLADGSVVPVAITITPGSLASQATAPPLSGLEMSCQGRTFPKLGKKLLSLTPLARQLVDPTDSRLGPLATSAVTAGARGLRTSYAALIQQAFQPRWWSSSKVVTFAGGAPVVSDPTGAPLGLDQFTLTEANFSLFWGLAIQLYEATLISDDTPFDRFMEGDTTALTAQQQQGLNLFLDNSKVRCINHHRTSVFTGAAHPAVRGEEPIQLMRLARGIVNYDGGFYNIGTRPTAEDLLLGGEEPTGAPISFTRRVQLGFDVGELAGIFVPEPIAPADPEAIDGSLKTPGLRNVELTPPYMRNGGLRTLEEVVQFYARGGDFAETNLANLNHDMLNITNLATAANQAAMVAFLKGLTDDRVRFERAPFDHPQLFVPNGHPGDATTVVDDGTGKATDSLLEIPFVGAAGRTVGIDGTTQAGCGDGRVTPPGEQCDGAADTACPGQCEADCRCAPGSVQPQLTGTIEADATINAGSASSRYGTKTTLEADGKPVKQVLFRVRVPALGGRRVARAILRLQVSSADGANADAGGRLFSMTSCAWDEKTVTWKTRPPLDGALRDVHGVVAKKEVVDYDVTAAITDEGAFCFGLETLSTNNVIFNSREAKTGKPALVLTTGAPVACGDDVIDPGEACDGTADAACPGACQPDCACPSVCGDGVLDPLSEECDGTADTACPGRCQPGCGCGPPATVTTSIISVTTTSTTTSSAPGAPATTTTTSSAPGMPATTTTTLAGTPAPVELTPVADTYIEAGTERTWDHGASDHLDVDLSPFGIAYLKFDLTGVTGPFTRAVLTLDCTNTSPDGGTVYPVPSSAWTEGTRNGLDIGSVGGPGLAFVDVDTNANGTIDATDVSPFVPDFLHPAGALGAVVRGQPKSVEVTGALGATPGLLTLAIRSANSDGATYVSRETAVLAQRPRLRLER